MIMSPATANDQYWPCGGGSTRADLGYPTLVGYTPTIDFLTFMNIPLCSGHIQN